MFDLYSTTELIGLYRPEDKFSTFFLDRFFPGVKVSDKETIAFDEIADDQTIAPFVSPLVKGVPDTKQGGTIKTFKPAYVKPTDIVQPSGMLTRRPGEAINSQTTPLERYEDEVADLVIKQDKKITRREEIMAVECLVTGKVIVKGDNYPESEVDYSRDEKLNIVLAGDERWSNENSDPIETIENTAMKILEVSGAAVTDIVLTPPGWNLLRKNKKFEKQLEQRRGVADMPIVSPRKPEKVQYKGMWGEYHIWVYANSYKDAEGNVITPMSGKKMLMVASGEDGLDGHKAYGAILDKRAGLEPLSRFPKMWDQEDPSSTMIQTQSAPLPVPMNINATAIVEVD